MAVIMVMIAVSLSQEPQADEAYLSTLETQIVALANYLVTTVA